MQTLKLLLALFCKWCNCCNIPVVIVFNAPSGYARSCKELKEFSRIRSDGDYKILVRSRLVKVGLRPISHNLIWRSVRINFYRNSRRKLKIIIIIIMVIFKCYFSGELIDFHTKYLKKKRCEHIIRKNKQIKSTVHDANKKNEINKDKA